ncbi:MAG: hypothetical protein FJ150_02765 [Euryarchaeota archaeon]|nr:hypothetical protein [Euryarchaeota archaeon]
MADELNEGLIPEGLQNIPPVQEEPQKPSMTEEEFIRKIKEKNKRVLLKLSDEEKERIVKMVIDDWYNEDLSYHQEVCDAVDKWDEQWRMTRKKVLGTDENTPDYRQALSTVVLEVIHANIMNTYFAQEDIVNVIPTEENDVKKIQKINIFMNWSAKNELKLFDRVDRLFHSTGKIGGCPYKMYWDKQYGIVTKTRPVINPFTGQSAIDPETSQPLTEEYEEPKLLYDGPVLEIFSRKDYIIPRGSSLDKKPHHEIHRLRLFKDDIIKREKEGRYYEGVSEKITDTEGGETSRVDKDGIAIALAKNEKTILEAYGSMILKEEDEEDKDEKLITEEEYIFLVCLEDKVLLLAKRNKFPLKLRPINMARFIPDDEGGVEGIGVMEFMESVQKEYDSFHNQTAKGTVLSNEPIVFFTPLGNMRQEKVKLEAGFAYPTTDPSSVKIFQFPAPNQQIFEMMKIVIYWTERLFSIGDYQVGQTSEIDPSAPGIKVAKLIESGNVRLNLIINRFNQTMKDIFLRHFLLYSENMPENKFMRIAGESGKYDFQKVSLEDFALKSLPDFELTGNVLSANKTLEAQKATVVYSYMSKNVLFMPNSPQGLQAYYQLTKWWLDKMNVLGVSKFLPKVPGEMIHTPEEENARFLQGEQVQPLENEDHITHIKSHNSMLLEPNTPQEIKQNIVAHNKIHTQMMQAMLMREVMFGKQAMKGEEYGGLPAGETGGAEPSPAFRGAY